MSQCILTSRNGLIGLANPKLKPKPSPVFLPAEHEWAKSDLDDICLDLFETTSRERPFRLNANWSSTAQGRLIEQDGVLRLKQPRGRYYPRDGPCSDLQTTGLSNSGPSFMALPVETRLQIYRYLLYLENTPDVCPHSDGLRIIVRPRDQISSGASPQILATCRQMNREGTPILYTDNVFRREFLWPLKWGKNRQFLLPLSQSRQLKSENLLRISRVQIFRYYDQWLLDTGDLKVLRDFPSLNELYVHIDLNDTTKHVNLNLLWQDAMKSIDRKRPRLNYVKSHLRLRFDSEYWAWIERCRGGSLDFSIHRRKKQALEEWMWAEKLFPDQHLAWSFTTGVSEYCGPDCVVEFVIDGKGKAMKKAGIPCRIVGDYDIQSSVEAD
ncbi:hypothetical protein B0J13DRAFT_559711 [Dactylonectria estremocensis]|uniref:Uncharacterized protein n=1 Tax=Dactylonectria estremocensis TaxID=1079267 RepID=A0A9P9EGZ4_9HYPO|nr:hypothetical protein B0J13DRAFT_559711 [Dactylonectria estremocensis]